MKTLALTLILSLTPAALAAQSVSLAGTARSTSLAPQPLRLSAAAWSRIDARIAAAADRGVPAAPLRRLAADGEARLASESRIHSALESAESDLRSAQLIFARRSRWASEAEIIAAADALGYGVSERQLAAVVGAAPAGRNLEVALNTVAAMVARGDGPSRAAAAVEAQLASGTTDLEIAAATGTVTRAP